MQLLRTVGILFLVFFSTGFTAGQTGTVKWLLSKECSLKVNGSTNINIFDCVISTYANADTLYFNHPRAGEPVKINGDMVLNIKYFDCHNELMTKDLRKVLKAAEFPNLSIRFVSFNSYPLPVKAPGLIRGQVLIKLAGATKAYEVNYKCTSGGEGAITMIGSKQILFSDFNIIPPRKLGGMIKTNNALDVEFTLKAKILHP